MRCSYCGAASDQPHNRDVEHGDVFRRNFTGDIAQCGCRWTRGPIVDLYGSHIGFGDVLHLCAIHEAASRAKGGGKR